jgi:hypothetical protein
MIVPLVAINVGNVPAQPLFLLSDWNSGKIRRLHDAK